MPLSKYKQLRVKILMPVLTTDFNDSVTKGIESEKEARVWYKENLEVLARHIGADYRDVNNYLDDMHKLGTRALAKAIKEEREELDELESLTN